MQNMKKCLLSLTLFLSLVVAVAAQRTVTGNMSGRVLTTHQQSLLKENNTLILAHEDMPAGMYILHVQQGEQTDSRKFTITK